MIKAKFSGGLGVSWWWLLVNHPRRNNVVIAFRTLSSVILTFTLIGVPNKSSVTSSFSLSLSFSFSPLFSFFSLCLFLLFEALILPLSLPPCALLVLFNLLPCACAAPCCMSVNKLVSPPFPFCVCIPSYVCVSVLGHSFLSGDSNKARVCRPMIED